MRGNSRRLVAATIVIIAGSTLGAAARVLVPESGEWCGLLRPYRTISWGEPIVPCSGQLNGDGEVVEWECETEYENLESIWSCEVEGTMPCVAPGGAPMQFIVRTPRCGNVYSIPPAPPPPGWLAGASGRIEECPTESEVIQIEWHDRCWGE